MKTVFFIVDRNCSCKSLFYEADGGDCLLNDKNGKPFCYVNQPSYCTDLENSLVRGNENEEPEEKFSAEACSSAGKY